MNALKGMGAGDFEGDAILSPRELMANGTEYIFPDAQMITASSSGVKEKDGYVPIGAEIADRS